MSERFCSDRDVNCCINSAFSVLITRNSDLFCPVSVAWAPKGAVLPCSGARPPFLWKRHWSAVQLQRGAGGGSWRWLCRSLATFGTVFSLEWPKLPYLLHGCFPGADLTNSEAEAWLPLCCLRGSHAARDGVLAGLTWVSPHIALALHRTFQTCKKSLFCARTLVGLCVS